VNVLKQLARKIRLSLGLGIVKLVDDARMVQQVQVKLLNSEVRDGANRYQDYGFTSVPLDGAECIVAAVGGNRSHLVIIRCDDGRHRMKDLQPGESAHFSDEGDFILLRRGRIVEIHAGTRVDVTSPIINCSGRVNVATHYRVSDIKVVGAQGAAVLDPVGGTIVDVQARTALAAVLARLRAHGLIAS
jgi:phage baseplate assembly protein V